MNGAPLSYCGKKVRRFQEASDLIDFILKNPEYSKGVLQILGTCMEPQHYSEAQLRSFTYKFTPKPKSHSTVQNLLKSFYHTSKDELNERRGSFLEELIEKAGPVAGKPFVNKWLACNVFYNQQLLWNIDKDLDVIFEFSPTDIEMHECKANLMNFLRKSEARDKINFMARLVQYYSANGWQCVAYFPTLCRNPFPEILGLENMGLTVLLRDKLSALVTRTA